VGAAVHQLGVVDSDREFLTALVKMQQTPSGDLCAVQLFPGDHFGAHNSLVEIAKYLFSLKKTLSV
jgi:hypothetical protein